MRSSKRFQSRFDAGDADPLTSMANLADVMLVFACGLIAALALGQLQNQTQPSGGVRIEKGRELPELPRGSGEGGAGYESVGKVYKDPRTGKLILVGESNAPSPRSGR